MNAAFRKEMAELDELENMDDDLGKSKHQIKYLQINDPIWLYNRLVFLNIQLDVISLTVLFRPISYNKTQTI